MLDHLNHTEAEKLKEVRTNRIDGVRLRRKDQNWDKAVYQGLVWIVLDYRMGRDYPQLASLVPSALNIENSVARAESWDEQLSRICAAVAQFVTKDGSVPWDKVQRQVEKCAGPNVADLPSHISFAKKYGGGRKMLSMTELVEHLRVAMPAGRLVSGYFFREVAAIGLPPDELTPRLFVAAVAANATCPQLWCRDKMGVMVTANDLKKLHSKTLKETTLQAEANMQRVRALAAAAGKTLSLSTLINFDVTLFMACLGKTAVGKISKDVIPRAATEAFIREIIGATPGTAPPANTACERTAPGADLIAY